MGKFDGVLLVSDYDDTLYDMNLTVSPRNREAIGRFIAQGGRFTVATGRAHGTFTPQIAKEQLTLNAPVVLSNGASIYDYESDRPLVETRLPDTAPQDLAQLARAIPEIGFEAYHGEEIFAYQPNLVTENHMRRVGGGYTTCAIGEMPTPWTKVILEQDWPVLLRAQRWMLDRFRRPVRGHLLQPLPAGGHRQGGHQGRHGTPDRPAAGRGAPACLLHRGQSERHPHAGRVRHPLRTRQLRRRGEAVGRPAAVPLQ